MSNCKNVAVCATKGSLLISKGPSAANNALTFCTLSGGIELAMLLEAAS